MTEPKRRGTDYMNPIKLMRTITQGISVACLILVASPMPAWAAPVSTNSWHGANGLLTEQPDNRHFMTHSDRLIDHGEFENANETGCIDNTSQGDNHPDFEFVCNRIQQTPLFDHYNPFDPLTRPASQTGSPYIDIAHDRLIFNPLPRVCEVSAVPLPGTVWLMGSGLIALGAFLGRARRKK